MPVIGLGVFQSAAGEETYQAVLSALKLGYRHIDSARLYQNEADVGRAIRDSGIPREEIYVTSKLLMNGFNFELKKGGAWTYESTMKAVKESVATFGFSYIDLYLLHAPFHPEKRSDAWRALEDSQAQGLIRDIGVSNFGEAHLAKLEKTWRVKPAVNQIEMHPFCARPALVKYCKDKGIIVQAYSPLTQAKKLDDPTLVKVSKEVNGTPAQVLIAWGLHKGVVSLPKSVHENRQRENLDAAKVVLSADQMGRLDALNADLVLGPWDPIKDHAV